jgi:hypothetical protein
MITVDSGHWNVAAGALVRAQGAHARAAVGVNEICLVR